MYILVSIRQLFQVQIKTLFRPSHGKRLTCSSL